MSTKLALKIKNRKVLAAENVSGQHGAGPEHEAHQRLARLMPPLEEVSELTVACSRADYSASAIARAVEDCDAHLLNLNVTSEPSSDGRMLVELRISHRNACPVARSLERYGYSVVGVSQDGAAGDGADAVARERVVQLLHYLDI